MFSVLQTVLGWGLNPRHWLQAFLEACAAQSGQTPPDLRPFLPWHMTDERKRQLAQPIPGLDGPFAPLPPAREDLAPADTS